VNKTDSKKYWFLFPILGIVLLDEFFKFRALARLPEEGSLVGFKIVRLAIHKNWGIAFDIPFKMEIVIIITVILGILLAQIAYKNFFKNPNVSFASIVILLGACGNFFDRIYHGFTVDYIIFFNQSAINLSDVIIILGVVLLLLSSRKSHKTLTHR
jgi:signal peptidase II